MSPDSRLADSNYVAPKTSTIAEAQNEFSSLRLLLAQRKIYKKAKWWSMFRSVGVGVVAIVAPLAAFIWPSSAEVFGSIAGAWIVLSRTVFLGLERQYAGQSAVIQEQFDRNIFGMGPAPSRVPVVTPELISRTVGDEKDAAVSIGKESLKGWYPVDLELDGTSAIAIAQRANASYSERLLSLNARVWLTLTCTWSTITIILSIFYSLSFSTFLLGVALPLMPALLDVIDQWRLTRLASRERLILASAIQEAINGTALAPINPEKLLFWQDQLFVLRRDAPQVSNLLYWLTRKRNELAMKAAANELSEVVRSNLLNGKHLKDRS